MARYEEDEHSQLAFIKRRTRWSNALFTTYSLGLSFFECSLLPQLRRTECRNVIVLCDVAGYRGSLVEVRARHAGTQYLLVPVRVRGGIFHPKVTYLEGEEGDELMVGSGNLTFSGHSRNVEVLDHLASAEEPLAFSDFADWLEDLTRTASIELGDASPLRHFIDRARRMAGVVRPKLGRARLIHTLKTPIADQLAALTPPKEGWTELLVLSPYHHPKGTPVRDLAARLQVKKLAVGVPGGKERTTSFPFKLAATWRPQLTITALTPDAPGPQGRLHAKWIEIRSGTRAVMLTGSVNATAKSLTTTKNVEIGVLRQSSPPSTGQWKASTPPKFVADEFEAEDSDLASWLVAQCDRSGRIVGQISSPQPLQGSWKAQILRTDTIREVREVSVDFQGRFAWVPNIRLEEDGESSVQLRMRKGNVEARGWVSIQSLLAMTGRARTANRSIARIAQGLSNTSDLEVLLGYVLHLAEGVSRLSPASSTRSKVRPDDSSDVEEFTWSDLDAIQKSRDQVIRDIADASTDESRPLRTLQRISRLLQLLGERANEVGSEPDLDDAARDEDCEDAEDEGELQGKDGEKTRPPAMPPQPKTQRPFAEIIEFFNDKLLDIITQCPVPSIVSELLLVWGYANLHVKLRHAQDAGAALAFADLLLRRSTLLLQSAPEMGRIDDLIGGVAAVISSRRPEQGDIAEMLERYRVNVAPASWVKPCAERWLKTPLGEAFSGHQVAEVIDALDKALLLPTKRAVLTKLVEAWKDHRPPEIPAKVFTPLEERMLRHALAPGPHRHQRFYIVVPQETRGCPRCYQDLQAGSSQLRSNRLVQCIHCHTVIANLDR